MALISRRARAELVLVVADRYRASSKSDKTLILDEFVRQSASSRDSCMTTIGPCQKVITHRSRHTRRSTLDPVGRIVVLLIRKCRGHGRRHGLGSQLILSGDSALTRT